jgi:hypothetical protein
MLQKQYTYLVLLLVCLTLLATEASALTPDKISTKRGYSPELIQTALAMQRHTEWVSGADGKKIKSLLSKKGYKVLGNIISGGKGSGLQAYVVEGGDSLVIAFRGTVSDVKKETRQNKITDSKFIRMMELGFSKKNKKVKVHKGFYDDYSGVRKSILSRVRKHKKK